MLFSFGADLRRPDGMRDFRFKNMELPAVSFLKQRRHIPGVIGAIVLHFQENAVNLQGWIDLPAHFADGLQQLLHALGWKVLLQHLPDS